MYAHHLVLFLCLLQIPGLYSQLALPTPAYIPSSSLNKSLTSTEQWSTLLANLLYFYDAQRSGQLPENNRVPWRNSSALNDGQANGIDLSGGFYDAGDYIKATFPLSFVLMSICWGAIDFGKGYDTANQSAYLDSILRHGLDWLIKAHPSNNSLVVQVASTELDNDYWGGDQTIVEPRPVFFINETHPGTDASAGSSAAFSACAVLYTNRTLSSPFSNRASLQNETYAAILLRHAEALNTFSLNSTQSQRKYQDSVPEVESAYGSNSYADELVISSLFLAIADSSNGTAHYNQAVSMYDQFHLVGSNGVYNWDSKTPGLAVLFAQANAAGLESGEQRWKDEAERYFDSILNMTGPGFLTPGGLLFYHGDSDSASLNPALNAAMLMTRYSSLASTEAKKNAYLKFAKSQMDYTLGNNRMNISYIVGPNGPSNPHSAMASGGNDINRIDDDPVNTVHTLFGAVVGGPDVHDNYYDIRSDWPQTEAALDYNAPVLTLVAWNVLNTNTDPFYTQLQEGSYTKPSGTPCDEVFPCDKTPGLSQGGKIAIAVVTSVVGSLIVGGIAYYIWLSCTRKTAASKS